MAICLPTYWAAIWLNVLNPSPVKERWTTHPWPLSNWALADFTSFPVISAGPSRRREAPWSSEPFRIGSTTSTSGLSPASGVVFTTPVRGAGALVGVVAGAGVGVVAGGGAGGGAVGGAAAWP